MKVDLMTIECTIHDLLWKVPREAYSDLCPAECPLCLREERNRLKEENIELKRRNGVLLEAIQLKAMVREVQ